ncbi:unnamed protein product [Closterium sp. Naga37s-1]|nr:unnamed protein product [Closterium sp. Naga37s-1]
MDASGLPADSRDAEGDSRDAEGEKAVLHAAVPPMLSAEEDVEQPQRMQLFMAHLMAHLFCCGTLARPHCDIPAGPPEASDPSPPSRGFVPIDRSMPPIMHLPQRPRARGAIADRLRSDCFEFSPCARTRRYPWRFGGERSRVAVAAAQLSAMTAGTGGAGGSRVVESGGSGDSREWEMGEGRIRGGRVNIVPPQEAVEEKRAGTAARGVRVGEVVRGSGVEEGGLAGASHMSVREGEHVERGCAAGVGARAAAGRGDSAAAEEQGSREKRPTTECCCIFGWPMFKYTYQSNFGLVRAHRKVRRPR